MSNKSPNRTPLSPAQRAIIEKWANDRTGTTLEYRNRNVTVTFYPKYSKKLKSMQSQITVHNMGGRFKVRTFWIYDNFSESSLKFFEKVFDHLKKF